MIRQKILLVCCLLSILLPEGQAFARLFDDGNDSSGLGFPLPSRQGESRSEPNSILNDIGEEIGSDRPELREDAREFRNFVGITSTAVEEFAGVDTTKYVGYLDLFLSLFRKKKQDDEAQSEDTIAGEEGQDSLFSSGNDTLNSEDLIGAAGVLDLYKAQSVADAADFSGSGGGSLGFNPQILRRSLTASELLALQKDQLSLQLGEEGQALTAAKNEESLKAMEAVNTVADEIQEVTATQDAIKLTAKQNSLSAVLQQITASETQQGRLAQLQGNQSVFRVQELMEKSDFQRDVGQLVNKNASFRAASVFSGTYGSQGGFGD